MPFSQPQPVPSFVFQDNFYNNKSIFSDIKFLYRFQCQGVIFRPGFIVGGYPDGPHAPDRTLMLAYPAADAAFRINIRLLQANQDFNPASGQRQHLPGLLRRKSQTGIGIFDNQTRRTVRASLNVTVEIAGCIPARRQNAAGDGYLLHIGSLNFQLRKALDRAEMNPGGNRLGADRTIFLANNAGSVHGPGQATSPVNKSGTDFNGSFIGKPVPPQAFVQRDRSNSGGRADIAAGYTVKLAAAGADPKIQYRRPQPFQAALKGGRMNHIGGTDSHALAALNAPVQKRRFIQGSRRPDKPRSPVGAGNLAAQSNHGDSRNAGEG